MLDAVADGGKYLDQHIGQHALGVPASNSCDANSQRADTFGVRESEGWKLLLWLCCAICSVNIYNAIQKWKGECKEILSRQRTAVVRGMPHALESHESTAMEVADRAHG